MKQEEAYKDYCNGMKYKDIAVKYGVSVSTVKSWAIRYWKGATEGKEVATRRKGCNHEKVIKKKLLKSVNSNTELTDKQRLFCIYYVDSYNATQAYLNAYGGDKASAMVLGCNLLRNVKVANEIKRLKNIMAADIDIKASDMIRYCLKIVGSDIGNYVTFGRREVPVMGAFGPVIDKATKKPLLEEVNYVDIKDSSQADTSLLAEIKQGRDGIGIKLPDKKWAWEQLAKYLGWDHGANNDDGIQIIDDTELE